MAKKKKPSGGKKPRKLARPKPPPEDLTDLPDRRALEGRMWGVADEDTPRGQAQTLMYRAFDAPNERRRLALARQALDIDPDRADAYVLMAEHARGRKEALALYEQGVSAGERALGPPFFQEAEGHFWGILETRPYMRARLGLALSLWTEGRRDEAVGHLQEMLRLNPNDNQGARYTLAGFLLFLDRDDDLTRLLDQYPDEGSAAWAYTRALLAYRRQGDSPEARTLLEEARKTNKHVPDYLLGKKFPPAEQPASYSPGRESEALEYVGGFLSGWKSTPGAVAWLRKHVDAAKPERAGPRPHGPLPMVRKWLKGKLSQKEDEWWVDFRPVPNWLVIAGEPARAWTALVVSQTDGLILGHDLRMEKPAANALWDLLTQAMKNPAQGEPHRPTLLHTRAAPAWEPLKPHLQEIGVALEEHDHLDPLDPLFDDLGERVAGKRHPGLLDVPGIGPAQVASFYRAAAEFYRQAPWKRVGYEAALRVECDKYEGGPWYAVLMGQSGLTTGLALYEDLKLLKKMWSDHAGDEENARRSVATTVTFGESHGAPLADFEAAQRHGWEVARPDAYPAVLHKERGLSMRPPLAWELELLEGALRAVPGFVERRRQDDATREEVTVPVAAGELRLALSWVTEV